MVDQHHILRREFQKGLFFLLLLLATVSAFGQTVITGPVVNKYVSVSQHWINSGGKDSVIVTNSTDFAVDDIVILYVPKGFAVDTNPGEGDPTGGVGNIGQYALMVVEEKHGNTLVFNNTTGFKNPLLAPATSPVMQLIKVAEYDSAIVQNEITAPAWDSLQGVGGVVALYVRGRLQLNANINVSGKGFKGADPDPLDTYAGDCYSDNPLFTEEYLPLSANDYSGLKGEGAAKRNTDLVRGFGAVINGGGGGNGKYAGGGGGSNFESGGSGYGQSNDECTLDDVGGGTGGIGMNGETLYENEIEGGGLPNRLYFGGGGGTGVYDASGRKSSPGGNGGGIVIIVADQLDWKDGVGIYADGDSVNVMTEGAGGGGGAGGCIVLDVSEFKGNSKLKLSAIGGKGGSTNDGFPITGPGGGGGGGLYWLSNYDSNIIDTTNNGVNNGTTNAGGVSAVVGGDAGLKIGLKAPIRGFLFNTLPMYDSVCSDVNPAPTIVASQPKGGIVNAPDYEYSYLWLQSPSGLAGTFVPAVGVNNGRNYAFSAPLTATTYYKRVVEDDASLVDTSAIFTYYVLQKIEGNLIAAPDSFLCYGNSTLDIIPSDKLSGAYVETTDSTFFWEKNVNGAGWGTADNVVNLRSYALPNLYDTTSFRRVVTSGVCRSVSNIVRINVLDPIINNTITSKDTLCSGQSPELMLGTTPQGGDLTNYWFEWEESPTSNSFISSGVKTKNMDKTAETYTADRYFRRIVYSGIDSSCIDVSDTFKIEVLETISGNLISTPDLLLCEDSLYAPGIIGAAAAGGDGNYSYQWQTSPDGSVWTTRKNTSANEALDIPSYNQLTYVRRVIVSGKDSVCKDTSVTRTIDVMPKIGNNVIDNSTVIVCQNDANNLQLSGSIAIGGGGADSYSYQWIISEDGTAGSWSTTSGTDDKDYIIPNLDKTSYFRRVVWSDKTLATCVDTTDEVFVYEVPDSIGNNIIYNGMHYDEICDGNTLNIPGSTPENGYTPGNYHYRWYFGNSLDAFNDSIDGDALISYNDISLTGNTVFRRLVYDDYCRSLSDTILIHVRQLPVASLSLSDNQDSIICEGTIYLKVDIINPETYNEHSVKIGYTSLDESGTVSESNSANIFTVSHLPVTDDSVTYYYNLLEVKDDSGCVATVLNGTPAIKVYQKPEPQILTDEAEVCGEFITVQGSDLNGADDAYWVELNGTNLVSFDDSALNSTVMRLNTDITGYPYGSRQLELGWKMITPRCDSTASKVFTFYQMPDSTILKKDTVEFYVEETYDLSQIEPQLDAGSATWTVDNSGAALDDSHIATGFTFEEKHQYTWTVTNGVCEPQPDNLIIIQHDLRQYNAFSPDNDNYNQEFVIPGLIHAEDFTFTLFNSWGTKVGVMTLSDAEKRVVEIDGKEMEEYIIWDGTLGNGEDVAPSGTYYYSLTYTIGGKEFEAKKGYIILRR